MAAAAFVAVGVGMVALAIATAPMARADSTDDAFIAAVHQAGLDLPRVCRNSPVHRAKWNR